MEYCVVVVAFTAGDGVTREVPFSKLLRPDQTTVRFDILDNDCASQADMAEIAEKAWEVISTALRSGKRVLCHCLEGKQRSCTVVAYCAMHTLHLSPAAACALVAEALSLAHSSTGGGFGVIGGASETQVHTDYANVAV